MTFFSSADPYGPAEFFRNIVVYKASITYASVGASVFWTIIDSFVGQSSKLLRPQRCTEASTRSRTLFILLDDSPFGQEAFPG